LDEKWAFVYRKQKHCDPEDRVDHRRGDCWDHVAFDPESRLVLGVVCGKRSATRILTLLRQVREQLRGRTPRLITSDEFGGYRTVLKLLWKNTARLNYATVCKQRENGRITSVQTQVVFGTRRSVQQALQQSIASTAINTSFLERYNATDRHRNARKVRRTYRFSKDWDIHCAATHFTYYTYNFCWPVRTLARRSHGHLRPRTPAMAARLTDHIWSLAEWLNYPVPGPAG
jgi:hypothetical protein